MLQEIGLIKTAIQAHAKFDNKEIEEAFFEYIGALNIDLTDASYMHGEEFNLPFRKFANILDAIDTKREYKFKELDGSEIEKDKESRVNEDDDDEDDLDLEEDDDDDANREVNTNKI